MLMKFKETGYIEHVLILHNNRKFDLLLFLLLVCQNVGKKKRKVTSPHSEPSMQLSKHYAQYFDLSENSMHHNTFLRLCEYGNKLTLIDFSQ